MCRANRSNYPFLFRLFMKRYYNDTLPSYNHLMQPDNPYYNSPPDFLALSKEYPSLLPFVGVNDDKSVYFKWSEPNAVRSDYSSGMTSRELTKVLMKKDFHIDWDMPSSHLCPGIPGRINYLAWLHDVLHLLPQYADAENPLLGIDVGTGASCIYPLLGNALYHWNFIATDIDAESIASAESLVQKNHLESVIRIRHREPSQPLLSDLVESSDHPISFCMCNPPFFSSVEEVVVVLSIHP